MIDKPIFDLKRNRMVMPHALTKARPLYFLIAGIFSVIMIGGAVIIDRFELRTVLIVIGFVTASWVMIFYTVRVVILKGALNPPLMIDRTQVTSTNFFRRKHISWQNIASLEVGRLPGGRNSINKHYVRFHMKDGKWETTYFKELTSDEEDTFFQIVRPISDKYGFKLSYGVLQVI